MAHLMAAVLVDRPAVCGGPFNDGKRQSLERADQHELLREARERLVDTK